MFCAYIFLKHSNYFLCCLLHPQASGISKTMGGKSCEHCNLKEMPRALSGQIGFQRCPRRGEGGLAVVPQIAEQGSFIYGTLGKLLRYLVIRQFPKLSTSLSIV